MSLVAPVEALPDALLVESLLACWIHEAQHVRDIDPLLPVRDIKPKIVQFLIGHSCSQVGADLREAVTDQVLATQAGSSQLRVWWTTPSSDSSSSASSPSCSPPHRCG